MRMAICGYPPRVSQIIDAFEDTNLEITHFVTDFLSDRGKTKFEMPTTLTFVSFFKFRKLIAAGVLDGLIICEEGLFSVTKEIVRICKFYGIPNVGCMNLWKLSNQISWLDSGKAFIPYLEANLTDSCNLNCKGCTHFSNLFGAGDFYALEDFKRDMRRISETADVLRFRLMGGEPLLLKNLDQYLKVARHFLPDTSLRLVTNGLLIPSAPQNLLDTLRETKFVVDISMYKPTLNIIDKIKDTLRKNSIPFKDVTGEIKTFNVFLSLHGGHDSEQSREICNSDLCRFLRNGKIYKCPVDALSFKFAEHFELKGFPGSVGIDIFAKNFTALLEQLEGDIELCYWCNETSRQIP